MVAPTELGNLYVPHEKVVVGEMLQAVPGGAQAQAHGAKRENPPRGHASGPRWPTCRAKSLTFQQDEDLGVGRGWVQSHGSPAKMGRFASTLEREAKLLNGDALDAGLGRVTLTHGRRMLRNKPRPVATSYLPSGHSRTARAAVVLKRTRGRSHTIQALMSGNLRRSSQPRRPVHVELALMPRARSRGRGHLRHLP